MEADDAVVATTTDGEETDGFEMAVTGDNFPILESELVCSEGTTTFAETIRIVMLEFVYRNEMFSS